MGEKDRVEEAEKRFQDRISEVRRTENTLVRRSLLSIAMRENDLIFALRKKDREGKP